MAGLWLMSISTFSAVSSARPERSMMVSSRVMACTSCALTGPRSLRLGLAVPSSGAWLAAAWPRARASSSPLAGVSASGCRPRARNCCMACDCEAAESTPLLIWPLALAARHA